MAKSADAFRTISEVAEWLDVQTHVLRFWESKFTQVKPVKRAGGRRYYRPLDMLLLGGIQKLLREDGLTIKGVQKILREKGIAHVSALSPAVDGVSSADLAATESVAPTKPAPFEQVTTDEVEPVTADIVPFTQDPRPGEPVDRPSFTQDAVIMPEDAVEAADVDETISTAPQEASPSEDLPDAIQDEPTPVAPDIEADADATSATKGLESQPVAETTQSESVVTKESQDEVTATQTPEPPTATEANLASDAQDAVTDEPTEWATAIEPEIIPPDPIVEVEATPEQPEVEVEPAALEDETALEATQDETTPPDDEKPIAILPSFLSRSTRSMAPVSDNLPPKDGTAEPVRTVEAPDQAVVPDEPAIEAPKPKPAIVVVPDTPFEPEIAASPRALSALAKVKSLTPAQATAIAPLLAQLRTARDRMGADRKE
ncbi:MAG: DNA-binding transcriptional MerR regulator [Ascidiaceihabitans sp.]|jgi:DNA-binding transcriptional MerR regulator|tara:strand:- start:1363 stop:2655 length:1293 start_codon:yes stop_codon:yes gene_type:complete